MSDEEIIEPVPEVDPPAPVVIDLDAIRAAHAAEADIGPVVRFNGADYQLPARLPLRILSNVGALMRGSFLALNDTFITLFGETVANELFATLDHADTSEFFDQIGKAYGVSLGN